MRLGAFQINGGMLAAAVLLAAGGALVLGPGREDATLHTAGLGVVILAGAVYFVARVAMIARNRRP